MLDNYVTLCNRVKVLTRAACLYPFLLLFRELESQTSCQYLETLIAGGCPSWLTGSTCHLGRET